MAKSFTQKFHAETLRQGKTLINDDGTGTTVFATTVQDPQTGKWFNVPGFDREAQRKLNSDEALAASLSAIRAGKVKAFDTVGEAVSAAEAEERILNMPADERGLVQRLFEKSGDELKKIEGPTPDDPALLTPDIEESAEDKRIRERVLEFRKKEGRDPKTGKKLSGLLGNGEFDEFAVDFDPALHHLQGDIAADPGEERQMEDVISSAGQFVYGDNMASNLNAMKTQQELYIGVADVAFEILKREKNRLEDKKEQVFPSVFFAETGATPVVLDQLWDLAGAAGLPGSNDQDQYAAALINLFRRIGESIVEEGDEEAISQAEELAISMALTNEGGSSAEGPGVADEAANANLSRNRLASGIQNALLGEIA